MQEIEWAFVQAYLDNFEKKLDNFQERMCECREGSTKIQMEQAQKLTALATEMSNWRWGLLICFGMVLASVAQFVFAQLHLTLPFHTLRF